MALIFTMSVLNISHFPGSKLYFMIFNYFGEREEDCSCERDFSKGRKERSQRKGITALSGESELRTEEGNPREHIKPLIW